MDRTRIQETVVGIVADALDRKAGEVRPDSSLVDDLGAESIDFLDIVFRLEGAFDLKIPEEEIWRGSADLAAAGPEEMAAGLARLRER
ncbi:acyl carrier protein, partial [Acidobacteria bacterium ACD]|nr:acyl carrier protein [Acidobacteria bacterium ACD]